MEYLADTVTIVRHFTDSGKIGKAAQDILDRVEANKDTLVISVVSLMEILYLSDKNRINLTLRETLETIDLSTNYIIADLTSEILEVAETVVFRELHDRLILSTAKFFGIPIISNDEEFAGIQGINCSLPLPD